MTDHQSNTTAMWSAEEAVLARYESVWRPRRPFANAAGSLRTAMREITDPAVVQGANTTGIAEDKDHLELTAARQADYIGDIVQAYALDQDNMGLYRAMTFSVGTLMNMRSEESYNKMQEVARKAAAIEAELLPYGLEADDVQSLQGAASAYHEKISAPRDATVQKSSATKSIALIIKEGNAALHRMDKMINTFARISPEFVREYKAARIIVDAHGHRGNNGGGVV